MMSETAYEVNMRNIHKRLDEGLARLEKDYEIKELDPGDLRSLHVDGRCYRVRQFEIVGVGNLLTMIAPDEGPMQMDTFTITPYYKNLPLFTTDYIYTGESRMVLNEIYDLVDFQDDLYKSYIRRFAENSRLVSDFDDMPMKKVWYDNIRPVVVSKKSHRANDDRSIDLFLRNLDTFIEMEQASPLLDDSRYQAKWARNYEYARALVEDGGVSTDLFVRDLGTELTKKFFYSVFFAPDLYKR